MASPTDKTNYRGIWGRDGVIIGLAALMTGKADLIDTFRHTLETLAKYQGPHGEIPSNVDPLSGRISYGGMTGRVVQICGLLSDVENTGKLPGTILSWTT